MMQTRRTFCGSALAVAGGGAAALYWAPDTAAQAPAADPILTHITSEFQRLSTAFTAGTIRADDYRAGALNFRLWAAQARGQDRELVRHLNDAMRREGRERLLSGGLRKAAEHRQMLMTQPNHGGLAAALTRMQKGGLPSRLDRLAAGMDAMHVVMIKRIADNAGGGVIVRTQGSIDLDQLSRCAALSQECEFWSNEATMYCALASIPWIAPVFGPICVAASASAYLYCKALEYYGC